MSTAEAATETKLAGSESVKDALIEAAADLLGEVGPRSLSVREIATRAGVNHGQIHHYFGGKRGLLEAAIRHLAKEHFEHSLDLAGGEAIPLPLSLGDDPRYFRALCQSVMDGDLDLVRTVDMDDEVSVPLRVLRALKERDPTRSDLDVRAQFAMLAAQQLGWVAFEELLFLIADVAPDERDHFREVVKRQMQQALERSFDESRS
jgi:AcrR family transcriptional regulator